MSQIYDDQGYVFIKKFINKETIDILNHKIDEIVSSTKIGDDIFDESGTGKVKQIQYLHKKDENFMKLVEKLIPLKAFSFNHCNSDFILADCRDELDVTYLTFRTKIDNEKNIFIYYRSSVLCINRNRFSKCYSCWRS